MQDALVVQHLQCAVSVCACFLCFVHAQGKRSGLGRNFVGPFHSPRISRPPALPGWLAVGGGVWLAAASHLSLFCGFVIGRDCGWIVALGLSLGWKGVFSWSWEGRISGCGSGGDWLLGPATSSPAQWVVGWKMGEVMCCLGPSETS
jgi:hypothetical protein